MFGLCSCWGLVAEQGGGWWGLNREVDGVSLGSDAEPPHRTQIQPFRDTTAPRKRDEGREGWKEIHIEGERDEKRDGGRQGERDEKRERERERERDGWRERHMDKERGMGRERKTSSRTH